MVMWIFIHALCKIFHIQRRLGVIVPGKFRVVNGKTWVLYK